MRDIVYFLKGDLPDDGRELRYSLRSLSNLPHGQVWLFASSIPEWVQDITWIPWTDQPGNKFFNIGEKFRALPRVEGMTDEIYQMDDDFYIIKPTQEIPLYWNARAKALMKMRKNTAADEFGQALHNTIQRLSELGINNPVAPSVHTPFPMQRSEIPTHWGVGKGPYEYKTLYINRELLRGTRLVYMLGDPKSMSAEETALIINRPSGLLSSLEDTFQFVEPVLRDLFPEKCQYEL